MSTPPRPRRRRRRHGTILIVTILIVFTLAALVVVFCRSTRVEAIASANLAASLQASSAERAAEQYVIALLTEQKDALADLTEDYFFQIPVGPPGEQGISAGYFWIVRPDYGEVDLPIYGLTDEAAKLNVNSATSDSLMRLPNMTDEVAQAILDWRDTDSTPLPNGAENEYYQGLPEPYVAKNDLFETVEELLMVRGVTRELLYGLGTTLPVGQTSSVRQANGRDMTELQAARGLYDLLTAYSYETGTAAAATGAGGGGGGSGGAGGSGAGGGGSGGTGQKINIADPNQRTQLRNLLTTQLEGSRGAQVAQTITQQSRFENPFDFYVKTGLKPDEFDKIFKSITSTGGEKIRGRININTAPRDVLMTLPGLEADDVDKLISQRQGSTAASDQSISWVVDALERNKLSGLGDTITTTSNQYSADIVAASGNGRAYKRVRIVVDAAGSTPQIVYRREITERGWPLDPQILASLRTGQGPGAAAGGFGGSRGSMPGGTLR